MNPRNGPIFCARTRVSLNTKPRSWIYRNLAKMAKFDVENWPERAILGRMSGPAPTSTAIKVLEGNPSHRPLRTVLVATGTPVAPPWLKGRARKVWARLVPELQHAGLVGVVDEIALASLCQTWAQLIAIDVELADPENRGDVGLQRRANQLRGLLLPQLVQFGLTPASRNRLAPPAPPTDDTMGGLLH
jgi:phage terminase small subunit